MMKATVSINNSRIEGSKSQIVPNITYIKTRAFDINLIVELITKIDD